jgi:hypothetical protein
LVRQKSKTLSLKWRRCCVQRWGNCQGKGTGKTVISYGAFEWYRRFERLYFYIEIVDYMIRKFFLVGILSLVSLANGQARVIETDRPVDVTGTIAVEKAPGNPEAVKGEMLYLTSGYIAALNTRRWPVKKVEIVFTGDHPENGPYYKAARAAAGTGKAVTLHGEFGWNHHFEILYFEID